YTIDQSVTDVYTGQLTMKKELHPQNYRYVVFEDLNNGQRILTRSTIAADETTTWDDGNEYPLVKVHITAFSHPYYTGEERVLDIEGRVDKFKARAAAGKAARDKRAAAAQKQAKRRAAKADKAADKVESTAAKSAANE
ncbi:MAG TPA: type B 50S ribosomal protein L31, partial [Candidatus Saccharimonadales bacterium]|nr:type B 50S ribosomal protein L31 [Candidatus Saccharimonadales bacterium]